LQLDLPVLAVGDADQRRAMLALAPRGDGY
jgi:hypothetical protein